jgi:hypothetical protein
MADPACLYVHHAGKAEEYIPARARGLALPLSPDALLGIKMMI